MFPMGEKSASDDADQTPSGADLFGAANRHQELFAFDMAQLEDAAPVFLLLTADVDALGGNALSNRFEKLGEAHAWLTKERAEPDDAERAAMGWEIAYDLRAYDEYPGKSFGDIPAIIKQQFFGGVLGGPSPEHAEEASALRGKLASSQTPKKAGAAFFEKPVESG